MNYLVFSGTSVAVGGGHDFFSSASTLEDAKAEALGCIRERKDCWAHVFCIKSGAVVANGQRGEIDALL